MSAAAPGRERLLTFEVAQAMYALPIAEVHEVAEVDRICCVPTLSRARGGVMNWHGDALPVLSPELLLGCDATARDPEEGEQVLVVSANSDEMPRLGLPVDRVLGLVDGPQRRRHGSELVVERRPIEGRVVNVLDPRALVARARQVIEEEIGAPGLLG